MKKEMKELFYDVAINNDNNNDSMDDCLLLFDFREVQNRKVVH